MFYFSTGNPSRSFYMVKIDKIGPIELAKLWVTDSELDAAEDLYPKLFP
jgi:hypothetical protein